MRFSSVVAAADETYDLLSMVSDTLDEDMKCLSTKEDWDHFFDSFIIGLVSVDESENEKFYKQNNKTGKSKHAITKDTIRYFCVVLTYNPDTIKHLDYATMRHLVVLDLFEKFKNLDIKLPKDFNLSEFVLHLRTVLCR